MGYNSKAIIIGSLFFVVISKIGNRGKMGKIQKSLRLFFIFNGIIKILHNKGKADSGYKRQNKPY